MMRAVARGCARPPLIGIFLSVRPETERSMKPIQAPSTETNGLPAPSVPGMIAASN